MASGLFSCQADLLSLIEASQSLDAPPNAMALIVTGDSRLPYLSYVRAALSVATALASCAFGLLCVWLARAPDDGLPDGVPDDMMTLAWYPYLMYGVALPAWLLLYNCGAALVCMLPEYKHNPALRSHLDATSTGAARPFNPMHPWLQRHASGGSRVPHAPLPLATGPDPSPDPSPNPHPHPRPHPHPHPHPHPNQAPRCSC